MPARAEALMTTLKRSNKYVVVTLIPYLPNTSATFTSILLSDYDFRPTAQAAGF